ASGGGWSRDRRGSHGGGAPPGRRRRRLEPGRHRDQRAAPAGHPVRVGTEADGDPAPRRRGGVVYVKGAPEVVLPRCTRVLRATGTSPLDDDTRANARDATQRM